MAERDDNPYAEGEQQGADASEPGFDEGEVFISPPTIHDPYVEPPEVPKWPKVVGIISTVWGSLGMLCGCLGLAGVMFSGAFQGMMESQGPLPPTMQPGIAQSAQAIAGLLTTVLLLLAGILCINRKPVARPLHLIYAVISLVLLIIGVMIQIDLANEMGQWVKDNPDSPFAQNYNATATLLLGVGLAVVLGLPWPLFCLIWFGFVKRTPEDMTGGVEADVI